MIEKNESYEICWAEIGWEVGGGRYGWGRFCVLEGGGEAFREKAVYVAT